MWKSDFKLNIHIVFTRESTNAANMPQKFYLDLSSYLFLSLHHVSFVSRCVKLSTILVTTHQLLTTCVKRITLAAILNYLVI